MYACERDRDVENKRKTEKVVGFGTCLILGEQLTDGQECSWENRTCDMLVRADQHRSDNAGTCRNPVLMVMQRNSGNCSSFSVNKITPVYCCYLGAG